MAALLLTAVAAPSSGPPTSRGAPLLPEPGTRLDGDASSPTIPLALYQTAPRRPAPDYIANWTSASPGITYTFHDDCAGVTYLRQSQLWGEAYARAFLTLAAGAIKSDLLRLCYLAEHGGFYVDSDNVPGEETIATLRAKGTSLVVTRSIDAGAVFNAFLGAAPRHPRLLQLARQSLANVEARLEEDARADPLAATRSETAPDRSRSTAHADAEAAAAIARLARPCVARPPPPLPPHSARPLPLLAAVAGPQLLAPLVNESDVLVLREYPRGDVLDDSTARYAARKSETHSDSASYWLHEAERSSVYLPPGQSSPDPCAASTAAPPPPAEPGSG